MASDRSKMRDGDMPLLDRIDVALRRVTNGEGQMRVPVEATDPDVVLFDCKREIERLRAELTDQRGVMRDLLADAATMKRRLGDAKLETARMRAELAEAHAEAAEQARLLGISGSVEARLRARVAELERECDARDTTIRILDEERDKLRAELETERMRLAACGVVALANTPESASKAREMLPEYRSASLDDVERAVDEQMRLRAENMALRNQRDELRLLLDKRPAMNAGLRESYAAWSASVATLDWMDEIDRARGAE